MLFKANQDNQSFQEKLFFVKDWAEKELAQMAS